jgi:hypothetical protein
MTEQFSLSQSQNAESSLCAALALSMQRGDQLMEYVIPFAAGPIVALYTLLVSRWLSKDVTLVCCFSLSWRLIVI